jgi:VWFA-related protein
MSVPFRLCSIALSLPLSVLPVLPQTTADTPQAPSERVTREIAQIEVMIGGPTPITRELTAGDFSLIVAGRPVEIVAADNICRDPSPVPSGDSPAQTTSVPSSSILFYFDQHNLTMVGRQVSLSVAREMIDALVAGGSRVAIVSAGDRLVTFSDFSTDLEQLHAALEKIRKDRKQWDDYPSLEHGRYREIMTLGWSSDSAACARARLFQNEELRRTEGALELFASVLGRFIDEAPPKIAIYFGDTTRVDAGRHYFAMSSLDCERLAYNAIGAFERVTQDAAAYGVRIYSVQAAGTADSNFVSRTAQGWATQDSQSGLKALALDTGGEAFLNGASVKSMMERMEEDSSCVYVLSFDPATLPKDKALAARVDVDRPEIQARARTQLVIQSKPTRRTAELLAAFGSPESVKDRVPMRGAVVPIEFHKGRFRALVQASIPASDLPAGEQWDIGMSLVFGSVVRSDESGKISVDRSGVPLVLESEMTFRPGPYDVALVGQEARSKRIAAGEIRGEWPDLDDVPVITEIVALQPGPGGFLRDGKTRQMGSLAVLPGESVRSDLPTAFLCLVCRPRGTKKELVVERSITGENVVEMSPITLPSQQEPCSQVRDLIPGNTLGAGSFSYSVSVKGSRVAREREFSVLGGAENRVP